MGSPNLDAMPREELREFWGRSKREPEAMIAEFWPDRARKLGPLTCQNALDTLAAYAIARSCAMTLREAGEIGRSNVYERHCDLYYSELPHFARW